ncbi:TPA: hypothetical protein DCX16_00255, partial [bacterium]|nr:hypothetical protein [bacterium]
MTRFFLLGFVFFISIAHTASWQEYFQDGTLEQTTLSNTPGTKWKRTHSASLKLSPQYPQFQRREWEPLARDVQGDRPELGDIDNDGDLDLLVSGWKGTISVFENTGTKYNPIFTLKKYFVIPGEENGYKTQGGLTLGDINKDGLLDILVSYEKKENGSYTYNLYAYKGIESFTWQRYPAWDVKDIPVKTNLWSTPAPELGDLDKDGDPDLILFYMEMGTKSGFWYDQVFIAYENKEGTFTRKPEWDPPLRYNYYIGYGANPKCELVDIDNNNMLDVLFSNDEWGQIYLYKNIGTQTPIWSSWQRFPYLGLSGDIITGAPGFADLDGDSDFDMLIGGMDGIIIAFENIGDSYNANMKLKQKPELYGYHITLGVAFADFDDDIDYDEVYGEGFTSCGGSYLVILSNLGSPEDVNFFVRKWLGGIALREDYDIRHTFSSPTIADMDYDGKLDIFISQYYDGIGYGVACFRNISTQTNKISFEWKKPWDITGTYLMSLGLTTIDTDSPSPFLIDLDSDKDYDCILTTTNRFLILENTGSITSPVWTRNQIWEEQISWRDLGYGTYTEFAPQNIWRSIGFVFPIAMDLDGDNLEDLIFTGSPGLYIYKRLGTLTSPFFQRMPEWENNLRPLIKTWDPTCSVDIDNDGDYDLAIAYRGSGPLILINKSPHNLIGTYTSSIFDAKSIVPFEKI